MKHKSGLIGFSYLAGLICAFFLEAVAALALGAIVLLASLILSLKKKKDLSLVLFSLAAALAVSSIYTLICFDPLIALSGETKEINGVITDKRAYSGDLAAYVINTEVDGTDANITFFYNDLDCDIGDKVKFSAKLAAMQNNADFAEESYYRSKDIFLKAQSVKNFEIIDKSLFNIKALITDFNRYISEKITFVLPDKEGALLKATFLGNKSDLPNSLSNDIKRCGISHLTSVSGLHLTIISHILMLLLSLTPINKNKKVKFGILAALILMFMIFFNMSMSVIRAGIMLVIYYGADLFMRKNNSLSSVGIAILVITLVQPYACIDIGFLLSVSGTVGVSVAAPYFCSFLKKTKLYEIKAAAVSTLCATLTTFPLCCIFFGGFSTVGVFVNILIYPFFFAAMICMILFALTFGSCTGLLFPAGIISKAMIFIIEGIGSFKYSYIDFTDEIFSAVCIISAVYIILTYFVFRSRKNTVVSIILSVSIIIASYVFLEINKSGKAKVILYSDGNYPCVIIEYEKQNIICAGSDSPDIAEYIELYLENRFLDKASAVVILNENHNYLYKFEKIPCDYLILPNDNKTISDLNNITLTKVDEKLRIDINEIGISVSPAKDPIDTDINIIYGYKKDFPRLKGKVLFSDSQMNNHEGTNFYYEKSEFYITGKGFLEHLKG